MSEHYYLLRNNRESGPFSLDELLQQCLLPGDLLWVEGHSQNWMTPEELPEVQTALPKGYSFSPAEPKTYDHISDREQALRAESLRRRALAALYHQQAPLHIGTPRPEIPVPAYALNDPEELEIVHHKPEKARGALPEFLLFCTLSALVVLGWRGGVFAHLIQVRPQPVEVASQRLTNESAHAASALTVLPQPAALASALAPAANDTLHRNDSAAAMGTTATSAPVRRTARPLPVPVNNAPETTAVADTKPAEPAGGNAAANPEPRRETATATVPANNTITPKEKEDKPAVIQQPAAKPDTQVAEAPKEEKRGFLRGLFKKKKHREEAPAEGDGG
ncbi:hypothetical protein [Flaviaesturariibacter aridisoli]|uniref:DUF4339 domain-containing protein n=1 Tax=Flaviaesturariibacter aridisoli TaxID=2545761 RepID=A0A4R4DV68_9BACT|nr:hypothetical protein [Flaviaesturariibacter aridisoli]TCZ66944.1 hypothetical protein E0486_16485 [Flaviaesturariibacter aridisoli]